MKMKLNILFVIAIMACITGYSQKSFDENKLYFQWELVANNYNQTGKALSAFTITNRYKKVLPAQGWSIYFNSSSGIDSALSITGNVHIFHVNGDIYKLIPAASFKPILHNESVRIEYFTNGITLNSTYAPSGLYIVWDADQTKGYPILNYLLKPFGKTDEEITTPEKIYSQNSIVKDISEDQLPKIFPSPLFYNETGGEFILNNQLSIQCDSAFKSEAGYLASELSGLLGTTLRINEESKETNQIILQKESLGKEAYHLSIKKERIIISASSGVGIFYAIQSLKSLIPGIAWKQVQNSITIPCAEVKDEPRFAYRSFMLDVARNFKSKETIFNILDLMALYKMNVFHFHFNDDEGWRIEIPGLPELTEIGARRGHTLDSKTMLPPSYGAGPEAGKTQGSGYYTRNEFIEILKYASARHIQVIPEIESPGHSRAAIKSMDARYETFLRLGNKAEAEHYLLRDVNDKSVYSSAQQWTDNVMCVAMPSVYKFLEKVIDELRMMYKDAGAPLNTIHMGGDEVPSGAWEKSPMCSNLIGKDSTIKEINDLWYYYFAKVKNILQSRELFLSGWEEVGMRKTFRDGEPVMIVNPRMANDGIQVHVWNNMVGWGNEDLPYRLANAGYKVVLSPVSNNYFDLAYSKSPDEIGYYWGGFEDVDKPFYFVPFNYYKTTKEDAGGNPVNQAYFIGKDRLTDFGKTNIVGIEGLLWSENVRSNKLLDYLLLPKLLGVAERAWAKDPEWALIKNKEESEKAYNKAWAVFVNSVGKRELPRLDYYAGGFDYRIPPPGAILENGVIKANVQFPGLVICYTTDGTEPTVNSKPYSSPINEKGVIKLRAFNSKGRGGRITIIKNN